MTRRIRFSDIGSPVIPGDYPAPANLGGVIEITQKTIDTIGERNPTLILENGAAINELAPRWIVVGLG